jgi:L-ascorbate metabolism protein UlaG (beta-lactamase superfamily)
MPHAHTTLQLLGHATFKLITPEQKILLVDPWLFDNPYIPVGLEQQPAVDLLLITHGHEDHMDIRLKEFIQQTTPTIIANNICRRFLVEQAVDESLFEPMNLGGEFGGAGRDRDHGQRLSPRPRLPN